MTSWKGNVTFHVCLMNFHLKHFITCIFLKILPAVLNTQEAL